MTTTAPPTVDLAAPATAALVALEPGCPGGKAPPLTGFSRSRESAGRTTLVWMEQLVEPHRDQILAVLREAPEGLDVEQLAGRVSLHPNTIRWHLGRLADAGLVRSRPVHHGRPGRPRILYEATGDPVEADESYRLLAEVLASALTGSERGTASAEAAGRTWGGYLVERPQPAVRLDPEEAADRVVRMLAEHGFEPQRASAVIEMHHCPFHELVDAYGDVVCGLHRGLLAGALDTLDAGLRLDELEPYPVPGICRARLGAC